MDYTHWVPARYQYAGYTRLITCLLNTTVKLICYLPDTIMWVTPVSFGTYQTVPCEINLTFVPARKRSCEINLTWYMSDSTMWDTPISLGTYETVPCEINLTVYLLPDSTLWNTPVSLCTFQTAHCGIHPYHLVSARQHDLFICQTLFISLCYW